MPTGMPPMPAGQSACSSPCSARTQRVEGRGRAFLDRGRLISEGIMQEGRRRGLGIWVGCGQAPLESGRRRGGLESHSSLITCDPPCLSGRAPGETARGDRK